MNSSRLKFTTKDKTSVTYKSHSFKCENNQTSGNTSNTFHCIHEECGAHIILDKKRSKIVSSNLEHMNHSPIAQRLRSTKTPAIKTTDSDSDKTIQTAKKRVSFSVQPGVTKKDTGKQKNTGKVNKKMEKEKKCNEIPQTRDASPTPTVHVAADTLPSSSHTKSNTETEVPTGNMDKDKDNNTNIPTCSKYVTPNSPNTLTEWKEPKLPKQVVSVHTQTDESDTNQSRVHVEENLMEKIINQEEEITHLKNTIASLEFIIENRAAVQHVSRQDPNQQFVPNPVQSVHHANNTKSTCHIIGDSHVRGLSEKFSAILPKNYSVQSFFQPGAGYQEVAAVQNQSPNLTSPSAKDSVIILCGTNDVGSTQWEHMQRALHDLAQKFKHSNLLCILGIPYRFSNKKMNFHITRLNTKIKNYVKSILDSNNICFLDPNKWLKRRDYASDGLHLNKLGKSKLCYKLKNVIIPANPDKNPNDRYTARKKHTVNRRPNNILSINYDLITFDELEEPGDMVQNGRNDLENHDDSTFSPNSPNYSRMFPPITPRHSPPLASGSSNRNNQDSFSLLDTPNLPNHIQDLINHEPTTLDSNYYRIAHVGHSTIQAHSSYRTDQTNNNWNLNTINSSAIYASPIARIEPGHNRPRSGNFESPGLATGT